MAACPTIEKNIAGWKSELSGRMCDMRSIGALYERASDAWSVGVCLTEELVWCDAHANAHPDCATAACRAEEVRLALRYLQGKGGGGGYDGKPVYPCPELDQLREWADAAYVNSDTEPRDRQLPCVPPGDKRSLYLPQCSADEAASKGRFFVARRLIDSRKPPVTWTHDA